MDASLVITKFKPREWKKYREIRLEALKNTPTAFGSSYTEELEKPGAKWKDRLKESETNNLSSTFFAILDGNPIGMMTIFREDKEKTKHKANLVGVYVKKEYRGKGVSAKLLEKTISWCKSKEDIKKIQLGVNTKNIPAIRFYQKNGFEITGTMKQELQVDGIYYDEHIMELYLK